MLNNEVDLSEEQDEKFDKIFKTFNKNDDDTINTKDIRNALK